MFLRHGKVKTWTHKTNHDTTNGTIGGCRIYKIGQNGEKRAEPADQRVFLLDGQHLCTTVYRKYEQTIPNIRCKSDYNNSRRLIPTQWNYVDTHTNPADDASRGVPSNSLQRWIEGPDFLNKTPDEWPKRPEELILITEDNDPEVKKSSLVYATDAPNAHGKHLVVETIERFSSWCRVKRVFAWILRYRRNLRLRAQSRKQYQTDPRTLSQIPPISLTELVNAETEILKYIQQAIFKDELSRLRRTETNDKISNTSCIINFVKGEREFRQEVDNWNQEQINDFLVQRNIKWTFNPPAASHHGGVWERCIRTVRKVMRAIMKEQLLDDEGLNTLMCEVEAIVNRRPLTKLSDNP